MRYADVKNIISTNVQNIEISGIRKFYNKVVKIEDAISLTLGQPDFNVPQKIKEAMIKAIDDNKTAYTSNAGIEELRKEISNYLMDKFHINYDKEEIRSEEHTSELQSRQYLVCRLLLEKKKKNSNILSLYILML